MGSVAVALVASMIAAVTAAGPASAATGTVLFNNAFNNRTADGTGTVTVPTSTSSANAACLTASGNSATLPLLSCAGSSDAQGSGKLRLTNSSTNTFGGVFGMSSFPTSNGLDVTFNSYQWGGGGADGMSFVLAAVDPANPVAPPTMGPSGGSLGYSPAGSVKGLANAYLGIGLDVFGNFSANGFSGTGCTPPSTITTPTPGAVVVRGPGKNLAGYCGLKSTWDGTAGSKVTLRATTRTASVVPVQVLINPTGSAFTSDSGVSVSAGTYKVVVKPVGQATRTVEGPLPTVASTFYPSSTWVSGGIPKQLAFGFIGSTGSVTDAHEISDAKVLTFAPVPQLTVASTVYAAPTSVPGDPVTYALVPKVLAGADEASPVSVTETVPAGVIPVGAYGAGWTCQPVVVRSITCTTTASSFPDGTTLPTVTVIGIVAGSSVTSGFIQSNSVSTVSSADAGPGADTAASAGVRPSGPSNVSVSPTIGPLGGGGSVTIMGSNIGTATAIEIGTDAEQQAGSPVVVLPCPGNVAGPGCFTVSQGSLTISSMPARASSAAVNVNVVTFGVDGHDAYVYADKPVTPATPTATAGITSANVTWVAPSANGSAISGYVVTPYLNGAAQTAVAVAAGTTTRIFTGLTAGGSYTFTVAATNAYGTSTSAKSTAVIPYTTPSAPTITAATVGSKAATLTWTVPNSGGSAITGYVVTPYIGASAQAAQTFTTTTAKVTGLTPGTAYTFKVAAQNLAGTGPQSSASTSVTPNVSPSLVFAAPPAGEVGVPYSRTLTVTNGTSPFTWSIPTGSLPAGMTLNVTSGVLGGTPTADGTFTFIVGVTDASGEVATKSVTLVIAAGPSLSFTPDDGEVGVAYSQQPILTGGTGPFAWVVSAGSLPAGLTLNASTGLISGTPTASGSFAITVQVTDVFNQTANRTVTLAVVAKPVFAATAPRIGQVGVDYTDRFDVTGGSLPLTWSIAAGSLPPGLAMAPGTGILSGTPTTAGSSSFTVSVVDANGQTATKTVTAVIGAGPIVITKTSNVSSAAAGTAVSYTISVTNTGSKAFTGITLSDPLGAVLDDATYSADAAASSGTVTYSASTLGWTGDLAAGATATITYSVTVNSPDVGNKVLSNTVRSPTLGSNCASGSGDPRCSATVTVPGLTIVKSTNVTSSTPGSTVAVSIVVTNTGPTAYSGATLTDGLANVLDDAAYNGDAAATSGILFYNSPSLRWTGDLPVGGSSTITYSVTVADPDTGNRSMTSTIVSSSPGSPCPSGNPAPSCTSAVQVLIPALSITNTAAGNTATPGSTVRYTVTVANTGQTPYTGASVSVAMTEALDDATFNNDGATSSGGVAFSSTSKTLTWSGNLAVGAVATITATATVRDPDPGDKVLTTVATSAVPGSTCRVGSTASACTSTVQVQVPRLTISTAADGTTTTPGARVDYTTTVTNTGQTAYTAATFSADLTAALDDATYQGDAASTSGSVSQSGSALTWTGDLAIGASATVTYSLTVKDPDPGNQQLDVPTTSATPGNTCPTGGTDPGCSIRVTVLIPALSIVVTSDESTTTPGGTVHYTVTAHNTGQSDYTGASVLVDFSGGADDARYNADASSSTGSIAVDSNGSGTWVLSLAPGASATTTFSATVNDPDTGNHSVTAKAVANVAGSTCRTGSMAEACTASVTVLLPGLAITKVASTTTASPGDTVRYTVSVVNNGETTFSAATFRDDLSLVLTDAMYANDAAASAGMVSYASPALTWTGALAPGAAATITYSVVIRDPDPGDKTMVNSVTSTSAGSNCRPGGTDPRCTATVSVLVPNLTITRTSDATTSLPGATVHHTLRVTNSGATSYSAAALTDELAQTLDDATFGGDAAATSGTVVLSGTSLTWTGSLAPGTSATISYSVTVHATNTGDSSMQSVVTSSSTGSNCATGSGDARCSVTIPISRLVIAQAYEQPTTTPGSVIHLTATFTNTGKVPYVGISVVSPSAGTVDDAIPTGDQTASSGTLVLSSTAISWTGDIPVGGMVTVTGTLTVKDPPPGDKAITGTLVSSAPGNNCAAGSTDARCTALTTVLLPELTVSKVASTTAVAPAGTVGYTVTVHNTGQTPYAAASISDALSGVIDKSTYNGDASATSGAVQYTSPTLSWTGALAVGATATITYSVTIPAAPTGDKTLINTVSSSNVGSTCAPASSNAACRSTVVILTPALTIAKTSDLVNATLGSTVTYTVKVTNTGQTPYPAASFDDSLTDVLDDATYVSATTTSGSVVFTSGDVTWSGALNPGTSATIAYSVLINTPASGNGSMLNVVTSTAVGNNCMSGSSDSRCSSRVAVTNAQSLTITKTADDAAAAVGTVIHYTITAKNSSTSTIVSAQLSDPLSDIVDDATYNGDASTTAGSISYAASVLEWTGDIAAGATATITYTATVRAGSGNQRLTGVVTSSTLPESDNCVVGSDDPRCVSTVLVAALRIEQHYAETSTTPGSVVHLSATFTNTGTHPYEGISINSPAADTVDDAIPNGDQTATSGTLILSASGILWTGNIPVGGTVTVSGSLTVENPDPGNKLLTGTLTSTALGNNCPAGGADPRCTATLAVQVPELTITKVANTTFVVPGGAAGYTITVHNTGQTAYTGAVVRDSLVGVLDDAVYGADVSSSTGSTTYEDQVLTWTGNLAPGASATITYTVTAHLGSTGDKTMINPVSSTTVGSTCPPASANTACRSTVAVLTPALTISSSTSKATTVPGEAITYTIVATNTGQTPYGSAALTAPLAGILDDATYGADITATRGTATVSGQDLSWSGPLATGQSTTITYSVTVRPPNPTADSRLTQTISSSTQGTNCAVGSTDARCSTSVTIASLQINNSADVATTQPNGVVRNTVTITNTGTVDYVDTSISDSFVGSLDDATYNGDAAATSGTLVLVTGTGRIEWTGDIPVGESVIVTGSLTVNNPDVGNKIMTTRVTTDAVATNCPTASPTAACSSSVLVLTPALSITKVANTPVAEPGARVGYTITVTNTGETAYVGARIDDSLSGVLDDATLDSGADSTVGSVSYSAPTLTWVGDLAVGGSAVITYDVVVANPDLGDKSMINTVSSDEIGSPCTAVVSDPSCASTVLVLVPALDIAIASDRTTTVPGGDVAYTVTIRNSGQTDYLGAEVSTELAGVTDDAAYAGDAISSTGDVAAGGSVLRWTGDLIMGDTAVVSYHVTVDSPDVSDHLLVTTATSSTPGAACSTTTPCTNTVTVLTPGLAVSTTSDVATATPGDTVEFRIHVENTGQTPYTGAVISTSLADITDDAALAATITSSSGVATYEAPMLTWTGTLAVGADATITYSVTINIPDEGNRSMATTAVAQDQGSTCRADSADPACTATVLVLVPHLAITKTADTVTTTPGAVVGYTITVRNDGETAYPGAIIQDDLHAVLTDTRYNDDPTTTGGGTFGYADSTLTWSGSLAVGASTTIRFSVTVVDHPGGDRLLVNHVTSPSPGSTCAPNNTSPACTTSVTVLIPKLVITKTADSSTVVAGGTVEYTVTVSNPGETDYLPASFIDSFDEVTDDGEYAGDGSATLGDVAYSDGTLTWSGELDAGQTAVVTYSVDVDYPASGDKRITNAITSTDPGSNCLAPGDVRCLYEVEVVVPALYIDKTADITEVVAGGTVHYTISATNTGEADYPAANLEDSLTGVLDDGLYNGDAHATTGTVSYAAGSLDWTGALPTGTTVVLTYSVTTAVSGTGDGTLRNVVASTSIGGDCPAADPGPDCSTSTPVAARSISLANLTPSFTLTGLPSSNVSADGAVSMTVTTNSPAGFVVTVQSRAATLTGASHANTSTIPIDRLLVRESGTSPFQRLSADVSRLVHQQSSASAPLGDAVSNDFRVEIPFVPDDTYSTALDYIVTAQ